MLSSFAKLIERVGQTLSFLGMLYYIIPRAVYVCVAISDGLEINSHVECHKYSGS